MTETLPEPVQVDDAIVFPIEVDTLHLIGKLPLHRGRGHPPQCSPVDVRPTNEKHTYRGIYLGDAPCYGAAAFWPNKKELHVTVLSIPLIYIPELNKTVYGASSWWKPVNKMDDPITDITDEEIKDAEPVE